MKFTQTLSENFLLLTEESSSSFFVKRMGKGSTDGYQITDDDNEPVVLFLPQLNSWETDNKAT